MTKSPEILEAAQRLFGQFGLKKVTTDDIARDAHVSKATIYKLFRNKQDILKAVVAIELDELLRQIKTAVEAQDTLYGKLRAHLLTKISTVHKLVNLHNVTRESMSEHWDYAQCLREEFVVEEARIIQQILSQGVQSGELDVADVKVTAHFMVVSLKSLEYPWVLEGLNLSVTEQVDTMLTILLNGLRSR